MEEIKNVKLTEFVLRQFEGKFSGTKITNISPTYFEEQINFDIDLDSCLDGYAPFCKLAVIDNFTNAKTGTLPITMANHQYLRSGYSSRREGELSVLSRWFELPIPAPIANYLVLVLYSKQQIDKEAKSDYDKKMAEGGLESIGLEEPMPFSGNWGVVAILGQMQPHEEPMPPITMMRNYMHISMGGSGMEMPIPPSSPNRGDFSDESTFLQALKEFDTLQSEYRDEIQKITERYEKSVKFWSENAIVKS